MQANLENRVCLDRLEVGKHTWEYELDDAFFRSIEKTELLGGKVQAVAELNLGEESFSLVVSVRGTVQVTCDRCLDPMDIAVDTREELEMEEDTRELDLNWLAYELIIVHLPLVHSHQEGGCTPKWLHFSKPPLLRLGRPRSNIKLTNIVNLKL